MSNTTCFVYVINGALDLPCSQSALILPPLSFHAPFLSFPFLSSISLSLFHVSFGRLESSFRSIIRDNSNDP